MRREVAEVGQKQHCGNNDDGDIDVDGRLVDCAEVPVATRPCDFPTLSLSLISFTRIRILIFKCYFLMLVKFEKNSVVNSNISIEMKRTTMF